MEPDLVGLIENLIERLGETRGAPPSNKLDCDCDLEICLLEKIARIACKNINETHQMSQSLTAIQKSIESLLDIFQAVHPEQALQLQKLADLRAEMEKCCPPDPEPDPFCTFEPCPPGGGGQSGGGYSVKSRGTVEAVQVPREFEPWKIKPAIAHEFEALPRVPQGRFVGATVPPKPSPKPLDFRDGTGSFVPGAPTPVTFRTFTSTTVATPFWPPDMTGAKAGDVVLMAANVWFKLSLDAGKTFTDIAFSDVFGAEGTYGGWGSDPVVHYVPQIDCFIFYIQSRVGIEGTPNQSKSVVKVALASPADLKKFKGGKQAWFRQYHFSSDTFGMNAWMDFPGITYGDAFLYLNTNTYTRTYPTPGKGKDNFAGKLFFELPLKEIQAGKSLSFLFSITPDSGSCPMQNIGDENYWAVHVSNSAIRVYSSKGGDENYYWRDRDLLANWPKAKTQDANGGDDVISNAPDSGDWISEDHRIIGATKVGSLLWFAWTAVASAADASGFRFPKAHIQIAKFDLGQDYKCVDQTQIWNPDIAFCYPNLTTNSDNEVGVSLAWGGGTSFGSHAVGILGDFVVWFGEASQRTSGQTTPTRFGDYLHVRLAQPDTRFFSAFGYAVLSDSSTVPATEKDDYLYVEFGREAIAPPALR